MSQTPFRIIRTPRPSPVPQTPPAEPPTGHTAARNEAADANADWWTTPMRTELGARIRALFAHPCDGQPYSEDGYDDRGPIVTVRNLLASVRLIEESLTDITERAGE